MKYNLKDKVYRQTYLVLFALACASPLVAYFILKYGGKLNIADGVEQITRISTDSTSKLSDFFHSKELAYIGWGALAVIVIVTICIAYQRVIKWKQKKAAATASPQKAKVWQGFSLFRLIWGTIGVVLLLLTIPLVILLVGILVYDFKSKVIDPVTKPEVMSYNTFRAIGPDWSSVIKIPYGKEIHWDLTTYNVWLETEINEDAGMRVIQAPINDHRYLDITVPERLKSVRFHIVPPPGTSFAENDVTNAVIGYKITPVKKK